MTQEQTSTVRTREEQIVELTEILYEAGWRFQTKARPEAIRIISEAEQRGYDRRVAEEKGESVAWVDEARLPNRDYPNSDATLWAGEWSNGHMVPLYLAPQPDTRDETIREKDAEIARLRRVIGELREALCIAKGALTEVVDGVTQQYQARNGRWVTIMSDDGEACDIIHSDVTMECGAALRKVDAALATPQTQGGEG